VHPPATRPTAFTRIVGNVVGGYSDPVSGVRFVVARPAMQPELWTAYLDGAWRRYREYAVEIAVDLARVRDGASTALFFTAVDVAGEVVGGVRVQGPYSHVDQAYALQEWAGRDGTAELRREVGRRLTGGVIEIKGAWVAHGAAHHDALTAAVARMFVHALDLMKVRYAMCTAAGHAVLRWQSSGGVLSRKVATVPYPDDRYQTSLMWWDRTTVFGRMPGEQIAAMLSEAGQLATRPALVPASPAVA